MRCIGPEKAALRMALSRLMCFIRSWQRADGLIGGTIATWWSSTVDTAEPHPMNQYPIILGYLKLGESGIGGGDWIGEARRIADGLVGAISIDGSLMNDWGDIPGKKPAPVIYTAGITALTRMYRFSDDPGYLKAAKRLKEHVEARWVVDGHMYHRVANQQCKWAEALLELFLVTKVDGLVQQARRIIYECLEHQIREGDMRGAIRQSRINDLVITIYVAKCLKPILRLFEITREARLLEGATMLAGYLEKAVVEDGIWRNCAEPRGMLSDGMRRVARIDYHSGYRLPFHMIRRMLQSQWRMDDHPSFIARAGDGIQGLLMLGRHVDRYRTLSGKMVDRLVSYQLPHGGIRNTIGYSGNPLEVMVQDVMCPTRWNAYAFEAMCHWACELEIADVPETVELEPFTCTVGSDSARFLEDEEKVLLMRGQRRLFCIEKPSGVSKGQDGAWIGELTGPRYASLRRRDGIARSPRPRIHA